MDDSFYEKEVRSAIERNTTKISLKDLEKKGFKNVKVLRQNDINLLIKQALDRVLGSKIAESEQISEQEKERYFIETKKEVERLMRDQSVVQKKYGKIEEENKQLRAKLKSLEPSSQTLAGQLQKMSPAGDAQRVKTLQAEIVRLRKQVQELEKAGGAVAGGQPGAQQNLAALSELQAKNKDLTAQLAVLEEKREKGKNLEIQNNMLQVEIKKLKDHLSGFEGVDLESLSQKETAQKQLREKLESLEKQNHLLEDQLGMYKEKIDSLGEFNPQEIKDFQREKEGLTRQLEEAKKAKEELEKGELVQLKCDLATATARLEGAEKDQNRLETMEKETLPEKNQQIMELKAELMMEKKKAEDLASQIEKLKTQGPAPAGGGGTVDTSKIVSTLMQQLQRAGLTGSKASAVLSESNIKALLSHSDDIEMESNIQSINVKKRKAKGIGAHLARLKSLKGGQDDE